MTGLPYIQAMSMVGVWRYGGLLFALLCSKEPCINCAA